MIQPAFFSKNSLSFLLFLIIFVCSFDLFSIPFLFSSMEKSKQIDFPAFFLAKTVGFYFFSLAVSLKLASLFFTRLSKKRFFLIALSLFSLASLSCSLAPSFSLFLIARIVQGSSAGALIQINQEMFPFFSKELSRRKLCSLFFRLELALLSFSPLTIACMSTFCCWQSFFCLQGILAFALFFVLYPHFPKTSPLPMPLSSSPKLYFHPLFLLLFFLYAFLAHILLNIGSKSPSFYTGLMTTSFALPLTLFFFFLYSFFDKESPVRLFLIAFFTLLIAIGSPFFYFSFPFLFASISFAEMAISRIGVSLFWQKATDRAYFRYLGMGIGAIFMRENAVWFQIGAGLTALFCLWLFLKKKDKAKKLSPFSLLSQDG